MIVALKPKYNVCTGIYVKRTVIAVETVRSVFFSETRYAQEKTIWYQLLLALMNCADARNVTNVLPQYHDIIIRTTLEVFFATAGKI